MNKKQYIHFYYCPILGLKKFVFEKPFLLDQKSKKSRKNKLAYL